MPFPDVDCLGDLPPAFAAFHEPTNEPYSPVEFFFTALLGTFSSSWSQMPAPKVQRSHPLGHSLLLPRLPRPKRRRLVTITDKDVRHLCKLSNLALNDADVARMATELEAIVGYVKQLQQVDTTGIEPIANVAGLVNITRPDVPGTLLSQAQVLTNAPAKNEVAILVPKAVDR
jgi:aspartyl-tRNA(Asn)/glutamyl-tRNA(Gln) amidotransferase subunit C